MNYKDDLISYRRARARETLEDAKILLDSERLLSAVNRIYYAAFYEVTALLLTKGLSSAKHSGVRALFNQNFVKTKEVSIKSGQFYTKMFEFRQKSDYGDYTIFEKDKVTEWITTAEQFFDEIEKLF